MQNITFKAFIINKTIINFFLEHLLWIAKYGTLKLVDKTICGDEKCESENDFFVLWTIKEAAFKYANETRFDPQKIDTTKIENVKTDYLNIGADKYVYSLVGDSLENIKVYFK